MIKAIQLAGLLFMFCSPVLQAGTIVEIQNNDEFTTVLTDGQKVRMNMTGSEYVIVDYRNHSVKLVNPQKQQVMLLDTGGVAAGNNASVVRTAINKLGSGQPIAGYKTQKFSYLANGKSCGVIYGSKSAYQAKGIKELFSAMKTMMEKQRDLLGAFASMVDVCTLADMQIADHVNTIGVPMRTEKNGRVETEIKSIKTDVALPADAFVIPASYKMVNMQQQIIGASKDIATMQQQVHQYQPQMQKTMRQLQQPGQMSPQAMEQMRRAQERMKQYQQPRY